MKRYQAYKESGIEWIGEVPTHWDSWRIKSVVKNCVNGLWGDDSKGDDGDVVCVRVADFQYNSLSVSNNNFTIRNIPIDQQNGKILAPSDLLVEKSGGGEKQPVGRVVKYGRPEKAVCSNFIAKITTDNKKVDSVFSLYYFSDIYAKRVNTRSIKQTTGIQNLDFYAYSTEKMPIPSKEEQEKIAKYLDHKTHLIDTLIEKKQKQIELLQEQRAGIINHAVTKGLNPNVKMKDTGIEWLGEVPEHWNIPAFKFVCSTIKDGTHLPPSRVDDGIPLLSVRNIVNGKFVNLPDDSMISKDDYLILSKSYQVLEKDVLLAIVGATIGKAAIVETMPPFTIQRSLAFFRAIENKLHYKFLSFYLKSPKFKSLIWENVGFSAQPGIYLGALSNFRCVLPPHDEQVDIVGFLEEQEMKIDRVIDTNKIGIEKLREYRTTLISEVVTGKIDVRDEVIP